MPITFAYNRTTEQAQIYLVRGSKMEERFTSTQECFLCALDPHPSCSVRQLEGRVVTAFEYTLNSEKTPIIVIDTGTARVEIHLTHYYRKFVRELRERGTGIQNLTLRLYHLPTPPAITEYKGQPRHIYSTNSYTLAVLEPDVLLNITDLNHTQYHRSKSCRILFTSISTKPSHRFSTFSRNHTR